MKFAIITAVQQLLSRFVWLEILALLSEKMAHCLRIENVPVWLIFPFATRAKQTYASSFDLHIAVKLETDFKLRFQCPRKLFPISKLLSVIMRALSQYR